MDAEAAAESNHMRSKLPSVNNGRGIGSPHTRNGRTPPANSSPRMGKRQTSTTSHHQSHTICNSLWRQKLTFHPYVSGDAPVAFSCLWPDKDTLVDTYREAEFHKRPYDLCKLLLTTNSCKALDALLDEKVLTVNCDFGVGCGSLLHLACALGLPEIVQSLVRKSQANTKIWSTKDGEGHIPEAVCVKPELCKLLPSHSLFIRHSIQLRTHKPENTKEIFELATRPDSFYCLITMLNSYRSFDVNSERNADGDLLIHVAIKGGLAQLPLLFALVHLYKANIALRDASRTTPLTLAVTLGEETLVEVLVCVLGVDLNEGSSTNDVTALHVAVENSRPKIVNMLLNRGADALKEDRGGCVPSFLAKKHRALECRQIIKQHLKERLDRICQSAISGQLLVSELYPSDLCAVSDNGCTLLMLAALNNHPLILRDLLKKGNCPLDFRQMKCDHMKSLTDSMDPNWIEPDKDKDHSLKTAVHFAAEKGNLACLQILLDANAHPSLEDMTSWLPLHYAVDRGHIECVKAILAYLNHSLALTGLKPALDISRGNKFTEITTILEQAHERRQREIVSPGLFDVAYSGDKDHLFHLYQNGDTVNILNESHDWALLLAAGNGYDDIVARLHQLGGHVTKRHRISRSTPLHVAARGGHTKVVRYLLQFCEQEECAPGPLPMGVMEAEDAQFIGINSKNAAGATPLELAASQGHTEVVKVLLERGASTTIPDSTGRLLNCSSFAGTQFLLETHRKERCRSIIDSLRANSGLKAFRVSWQGPSDFNLYSSNGDNMLMVASQYSQPEVLQFLLDQAAAVKPSMLMSSDQEPLLFSSLTSSRSEESSDTSWTTVHARNKSDSFLTPSLSLVPKPYDLEGDKPPQMHTALPSVAHQRARATREQRLTSSGGSAPEKSRVRGRPHMDIPPWRRSSTSGTPAISSSEDDDPVHYKAAIGNAARAYDYNSSDNEATELAEPFSSLLRFCNARDGQTALHRASGACQHRNVALLLKRDEGLANIQDHLGNTALGLACLRSGYKNGKATVQTLLNCKRLMTSLRNNKNEFPEERCLKSAIKKLVYKARQSRAGTELGLPDPPNTCYTALQQQSGGLSVSMERANGQLPPGAGVQLLPGIPEVVTPYSSVLSDFSLSDLNSRLQAMKTEINAVPAIPEPN